MTESATISAPTTPEAAQGRLTELSSNREWGAKLLAQDPAAVGEFQNLTKLVASGNPTVETLAHDLSDLNGTKMVEDFLAGPLPNGFPDLSTPAGTDLAEMLRGKPISPELHNMVQAKLDSMLADREWVKRFDAKDQRAMREFQLTTVLLTADISEKAA